jgi:excinuclease ABC subunit C
MTLETQKAVTTDFIDRDIIAFSRKDGSMTIVVLFARGGKIIGSKEFTLKKVAVTDEEVISSFLNQFYREGKYVPREILIPITLEDHQIIQEFLKEKKGETVTLITPQRGEKKKLIEIARLNAESAFTLAQKRIEDAEKSAQELKDRLHLHAPPLTVECFDISNLGGHCAVGSMVHFKDGEALKDCYRRFRIRTVDGADDCAMLYEVLKRRFKKGEKKVPFPDLVVVDGGKGQLNAALAVFKELGITSIEVIALAKGRGKQRKGTNQGDSSASFEQIFLPERKNPLILSSHSPALLFLQKVRDESHRFAVSYHRRLRHQKDFSSPLDAISGVGTKTRTHLLKYFGSVDKVSSASLEDLSRVPHLKAKVAEAVYNFFRDK